MSDSRQREDDYWYWRNREIDAELDAKAAALSSEQDALLSGKGILTKYRVGDMSFMNSLLGGHVANRTIERLEKCLRAGKNKEALEGANAELSINPEDVRALTVRAEAHLCLGNQEAAIRDATNALRLGAKGSWAAWAHAVRGDAGLGQGRLNEALKDAQAALKISPKYPYALAVRGAAYCEQGRVNEAFDSVEEALRLSPGFPFGHLVRAVLHLDQGRFAQAVRDATEAMVRSHPDQRALLVRAEAYRRLGRYQEASRDAREILRISPGHKDAARLLKLLTGA